MDADGSGAFRKTGLRKPPLSGGKWPLKVSQLVQGGRPSEGRGGGPLFFLYGKVECLSLRWKAGHRISSPFLLACSL